MAKRVWGLPGEQIELRSGEAWIDGHLLQKTIAELAAVCVPISDFPHDTFSHCWIEDGSRNLSRIESTETKQRIVLQPQQSLQFRYARPNRDPATPTLIASQLWDDYSCNQNSTAELHPVEDYLVAVELSEPSNAAWQIELTFRQQKYVIAVHDRMMQVGSNEHVDNENVNNAAASLQIAATQRLVVAVCDGRLLASSESDTQQLDLTRNDDTPTAVEKRNANEEAGQRLVAISTGHQLAIKRLIVARDLWLGPRQSRADSWTAEPNAVPSGYFVLGDNLPLSIDSRDDVVGRISPEQIIGLIDSPSLRAESRLWMDRLFLSPR